jgi:diketogulonate reductase-like aldo/keto reductase
MPGETTEPIGRAPRPPRGDPNLKAIRLRLTTEEWRKLRALAAQEGRDVQETIGQIVRQKLEREPARTAHGSP